MITVPARFAFRLRRGPALRYAAIALAWLALFAVATQVRTAFRRKPPSPAPVAALPAARPGDSSEYWRRYRLPPLQRMTDDEVRERLEPLQVVRRFRALGLTPDEAFSPDARWRAIAARLATVRDTASAAAEPRQFTGTSVSALNRYLAGGAGRTVEVTARELTADATLEVPSGIALVGAPTRLRASSPRAVGIEVADAKGVRVEGFEVSGPYRVGIAVKNGEAISLVRNVVRETAGRGIAVMGHVRDLALVENEVADNARGGIFVRGDIGPGSIEGNRIRNNRGTSNWEAGLVLSAVPVRDVNDPDEGFQPGGHFPLPLRLDAKTAAPHDLVVRDNRIECHTSSGAYCDGTYRVYLIGNALSNNDKEGLCLDNGTVATLVEGNLMIGNGTRSRQTDADLRADFVLAHGRLPDGSAKAKLPGISLDNTAYNAVCGNVVRDNAGSGLKMVRTSVRNLIGHNSILENNRGRSDAFHFFGIELGHAAADAPAEDLDFAPDYENLVFRNVVDGAHFSGIFLAAGCHRNDLFDNVLFGASAFSLESLSTGINTTLNNTSNVPTRGIPLSCAVAPSTVAR